MTKPCISCTKCQDPNNCENKNCSVWRQWFLYEWAKLRARYGGSIQKEK